MQKKNELEKLEPIQLVLLIIIRRLVKRCKDRNEINAYFEIIYLYLLHVKTTSVIKFYNRAYAGNIEMFCFFFVCFFLQHSRWVDERKTKKKKKKKKKKNSQIFGLAKTLIHRIQPNYRTVRLDFQNYWKNL